MRLSNSKMNNEMHLREPRLRAADGHLNEYGFIETDTGFHSTDRNTRKSEIEDLGEGTNLYFKFLKYFMCIFFVATLLCIPALSLYMYGTHYGEIADFTQLTGFGSLGNLGTYLDAACASADLPQSRNKAAYIGFQCPPGKQITGIR
jgi:hypothetical protein